MTTVDITLQTGQLLNIKSDFLFGEYVKLNLLKLIAIKNYVEALGEEPLIDAENKING
jgi:hypothetical protein